MMSAADCAGAVQVPGVLFVCSGNICRSPAAEAIFRAQLGAAGLAGRCNVDSAGIHSYHEGEPPDPRTVSAALRTGYSMEGIIARQVCAGDFAKFGLILGCDRSHVGRLRSLAPPGSGATIKLLGRYADGEDIADPYYSGADAFASMLIHVERCCAGLLAEVVPQLG